MTTSSTEGDRSVRPYETLAITENPYTAKRPVAGLLVAVLRFKSEQRALKLIAPYSRCVRQGEVHELAVTDEAMAAPGATVQRAAFLGFVEFEMGGVLLLGDKVRINGNPVGIVCGFDHTHAPNHLNIVLSGSALLTGADIGLQIGDQIVFEFDETMPWPSL